MLDEFDLWGRRWGGRGEGEDSVIPDGRGGSFSLSRSASRGRTRLAEPALAEDLLPHVVVICVMPCARTPATSPARRGNAPGEGGEGAGGDENGRHEGGKGENARAPTHVIIAQAVLVEDVEQAELEPRRRVELRAVGRVLQLDERRLVGLVAAAREERRPVAEGARARAASAAGPSCSCRRARARRPPPTTPRAAPGSHTPTGARPRPPRRAPRRAGTSAAGGAPGAAAAAAAGTATLPLRAPRRPTWACSRPDLVAQRSLELRQRALDPFARDLVLGEQVDVFVVELERGRRVDLVLLHPRAHGFEVLLLRELGELGGRQAAQPVRADPAAHLLLRRAL